MNPDFGQTVKNSQN